MGDSQYHFAILNRRHQPPESPTSSSKTLDIIFERKRSLGLLYYSFTWKIPKLMSIWRTGQVGEQKDLQVAGEKLHKAKHVQLVLVWHHGELGELKDPPGCKRKLIYI